MSISGNNTVPDSPSSGPPSWLIHGSLIALGLLAFWPTVGFDFVNWDDPAYVWHNDLIRDWSPSTLYGILTETVTRNYAPLTITTLLIDHTLWGMQPSGYHATNVLLHVVNGILVFLLVRQLVGSSGTAWLTAALFLVHPVQIESVAWISSRKGLLSGTFILAALWVRLRPDADTDSDLRYLLLLGAALLSKALAVVVPPIVLLYDVIVARHSWRDAIVRQVIPGLMSLLLLLKTMAAQHTVLGGLRGHLDLSLPEIVAVDLVILWRYIGMLVWPRELCVLYDPPVSGIGTSVLAAALAWTAVAGLLWMYGRRCRLLIWSVSTFFLLLFPVLNFFRITTLMNDRYLYLPCIPFFAAAVSMVQYAGSADRVERLPSLRIFSGAVRWAVGLSLTVAALLATWRHLPVWQNSFTLWHHAMQHVPQLPTVRMQWALTHHDSGRTRQAVRILQQALIETQPDAADRRRMETAVTQWTAELEQSSRLGTGAGSDRR